jgi:hypothetical protein
MKFSKLALVMGSTLALGAGLCVGTACSSSSSNSGGGSGGGSGSGSGGAVDSGSASDVTTGDDGGTGDTGTPETDGGSGVDCGSIPTLHMNPAGSIFCGYGAGDAGEITCATGTECCLGGEVSSSSGYSPQACSTWTANGAGCTNPAADSGAMYPAIGIACNQNSDCTANGQATGGSCCLVGASVSTVAGCGYPKAKSGDNIQCESTPACASGEIQVCSSQADCPTGTTCTAGKWKIYDLGFCQ